MSLRTPNELYDLSGRVAVVTGASSGIGVSMAKALAGAGARVVLAARRQALLDDVATRLRDEGAEAIGVACDVVREADVDALVDATLAAYGRVDVLVNNAGITDIIPAEADGLDNFGRVVEVNLHAVFTCTQRFGRVMLEAERGSIVNIASILGLVGTGQVPQAAYAASKGAVINMTREIAAQWARRGVRVNAIAPGWFESEMTGEMFEDDRSKRWMNGRTPMGRTGTPGELDGALIFLASDAASFVTGQTLPVDGGWTIV